MQSDSGVVIKPCQDVVTSPDEHYIDVLGCYSYYYLSDMSMYTFRAKRAVLPTGNGNECTSKSERCLEGVADRHAYTCRFRMAINRASWCLSWTRPNPPT